MLPETLYGKLPQIQTLLNYPLLDGGKKDEILNFDLDCGRIICNFHLDPDLMWMPNFCRSKIFE